MNKEKNNKPNPIAVAIPLCIVWWSLVYFFGIFQVLVWSIVITAGFAIGIKLWEGDRSIY